MRELVAAAAREPERLVKARLSSSQVLAVAHALIGGPHNEVPWSFLAGLNRLRNRLAHEVEAPDIDLEMARLTRLVPVSTDAAIYLPQKAVYMFTLAVARVAGELHSRGRALIRTPAAPGAT